MDLNKISLKRTEGQWSILTVTLIAGALAGFGSIPLMGIPGMLVLALSDLLIQALGGSFLGYQGIFAFSKGDDYVWPAALLTTLVWPFIIVPAYILAFRIARTKTPLKRWGIFLFTLVLWGMLITVGIYLSVRQ